jgi:hypothetical protein
MVTMTITPIANMVMNIIIIIIITTTTTLIVAGENHSAILVGRDGFLGRFPG